jgi:hypothetical protein
MSDEHTKPNGQTLSTVYARLDQLQENSDRKQNEFRSDMVVQFQTISQKFDISTKEILADIKDCRERMIKLEARDTPHEYQKTFCPNTSLIRSVITKMDSQDALLKESERLKEDREYKDSQRVKAALVSAVIAVGLFAADMVAKLLLGA